MNPSLIFIMAGGSGERFWPLSRRTTPKHLLKLFSEKTLVEETIRRLPPGIPQENIYILTNQAQLENTRAAVSLPPAQIIAEPAKRDTAPAAALATAIAYHRDPNAVVTLLPADSLIRNQSDFRRQLGEAMCWAAGHDGLVTFSIRPTFPSTGFGYLELGSPLPEQPGMFEVKRFVEKPQREKAEEYLKTGRYGWNAGMFVWRAEVFLRECETHQPQLATFIRNFDPENLSAYLEQNFAQLPKISVDYAIMEKARRVVALRAEFDWDDVGTWTALPTHLGQDAAGNTFRGQVVEHESHRCLALATSRVIALCGVQDLVVVETPDAVLVCHREKVQEVKKLIDKLPDEVR